MTKNKITVEEFDKMVDDSDGLRSLLVPVSVKPVMSDLAFMDDNSS